MFQYAPVVLMAPLAPQMANAATNIAWVAVQMTRHQIVQFVGTCTSENLAITNVSAIVPPITIR